MYQVTSQVSTNVSTKISPKGSPAERLWIIAEAPLSKDKDKGFLFSSAMGWSFDKLLGESGLTSYYCDYFDPSNPQALVDRINNYKPPILICLDKAGANLLPQIKRKEDINLWAGSLLTSDKLNYPHYILPTFGPETCIQDWTERQIVKYIDLGKAKDEFIFFKNSGFLNPLPIRRLDIDLDLHTLIYKMDWWADDNSTPYISVDIETIYPREKSDFYGHPGLPVTIGLAPSSIYGISFSLFQEQNKNSVRLWKALANLMDKKTIIGQNFFLFDYNFFYMLGMPCDLFKIQDTMFRHSVLWPELSHKLQFQTRQYTREPYYKQEGHGWNAKDLARLKRYNALDVTVTFEIFEAQEREFDERPHLR
jgi:hypothetical protein